MESFAKTDSATLKKVETEAVSVLIHLKKLLRIKNRLRSPLLQLPTETIIRILSYNMEYHFEWLPSFGTCHYIHWIMRTATELWWKVDCAWPRIARIVFARSKGNLQAIVARLDPREYNSQYHEAWEVLDHWRDTQVLHSYRLHTLELRGASSDITHFSWIFERPLPCLRHLKIHFFGPLGDDPEDELELPIPEPVTPNLPMNLQLRVLDLSNATLPWSSNAFAGLNELHMSFRDCSAVVEISVDELLGILNASPRLESLSLVQVRVKIPITNGEPQFDRTRIVQLPRLTSLKLDNYPEFVGYTLGYMDTPAINSLEIRSYILPTEISWSLRLFFLDHRLPNRLFPNPPVFRVGFTNDNETFASIGVTIGAFEMQFDFELDVEEEIRSLIVASILPLVPPSVTALDLRSVKLSEQEWREFFRLHPEVSSIYFSKSYMQRPIPELLWDALSPAGPDEAPLCPKLDSISSFASTPLRNCLLNRKNAGFGLRYLEFGSLDPKLVGEFSLLVEELNITGVSDEMAMVRPASTNDLDLACSPRLTVGIPMRGRAHQFQNLVTSGVPTPGSMEN